MFEIGETVICCKDYKLPHTREELEIDCPNFVKKGEKYKIREFHENDGIVLGVLVEELINPLRYFRLINRVKESSFRADRFRKLRADEVAEEVLQEEKVEQTLY